jgi:hypothetical protein
MTLPPTALSYSVKVPTLGTGVLVRDMDRGEWPRNVLRVPICARFVAKLSHPNVLAMTRPSMVSILNAVK